MLLPLLNYANNDTKEYGLDVPYNLEWVELYFNFAINFVIFLGTSSFRPLARLGNIYWAFLYNNNVLVCDLEPNRQEQMPVEESGNMVSIVTIIYLVHSSKN